MVDQGDRTGPRREVLERQAFQLSQLYSTDPALRDGRSGVRGYIASSVSTPEGWVYDPRTPEWSAAQSVLSTACDEAGSPVILKMESGMGG